MMQLHRGDCLEVMRDIPDGSIDCVLTDPPYGTTACKWDSVIPFEPMWKQLVRITRDSSAICLFSQMPFSAVLVSSNLMGFRYEWIWEKSTATGHLNAKRTPMKAHEAILVFYRSLPTYNPQKTFGHKVKTALNVDRGSKQSPVYGQQRGITSYSSTERYPRSVLKFPADKQTSNLHPTQKPVELLRYLIRTYTQENETVLDFTMGSGSAGVACQLENRNFIGIEKDADYFAVAQERIAEIKEPLFMAA